MSFIRACALADAICTTAAVHIYTFEYIPGIISYEYKYSMGITCTRMAYASAPAYYIVLVSQTRTTCGTHRSVVFLA